MFKPRKKAQIPATPVLRKGAPRKPSAHHDLLFGLAQHKRAVWTIAGVALLIITAVVLILVYTELSWAHLTGWIDDVDPILALPLMALLPIVGFPVAIVYLFAGARFGPLGGGAVVAVITAIHLIGTYLIANSFLRAPLQRFIEKRHKRLPAIPEDEQSAVCVVATLVPGLPYFVRNYLLALGGVKLKYFFMVCLPIYVGRSYVTILLGDMGSEFSRNKLVILLAFDVLKVAICAFVIWRLRERHRKHHAHAESEAPHESHESPDVVPPPNAAAK